MNAAAHYYRKIALQYWTGAGCLAAMGSHRHAKRIKQLEKTARSYERKAERRQDAANQVARKAKEDGHGLR